MNKKYIYILPIILIAIFFLININYKNDSEEYPAYVKNIEIDDKFFESLGEKESILFKILNSIDFYDTAKGTFVTKNMRINEEINYKFEADIVNNRLKVESKDNVIIIENNIKYEIDKRDFKYRKFEIENVLLDKNIGKLKPKDRIVGKKDKEFISRSETPYLLIVNKILLNEELGIDLLNNDNWSINESKNYLDRKTVEIKRKLGFTGKSGENNSKVLVDKENGVILKEEIFNREDEVVFSTEVKEIEFNKKLSSNFIEEYENLREYTLIE